uniref:GST N-terminal domain-containing protein n=1 Tax=Chromera velia CCMP2878 TaxID=1169474 RepID=A0A0G4HYN7_9ALVE|eukprot:Cvel_33654.t1-p1 / transcript=Cvel_33654.t1 / gene=Cvel_33654 / organism=Chromera_velia_CCMP2878 / gene_product=Glutathione S-transferase L3, putative / transcript_product=Glutathione S-transferase L3, putative / location=Cvel_scaffold5526:677-1654(-) / protein_length=326 / sequence_SO=supercontig / SO=protein_coding / is_pseudo=false
MAVKAAQTSTDALWVSEWKEAVGEQTIARRSKSSSTVELFCSWFCPFAQRAWIALEEKGIDYKYVEVNPYEVDPQEPGGYTKKQLPLSVKREVYPKFIDTSPRGLVPALSDKGKSVWESLQLIEYIDEAFKGPALMPETPHQRALARIWADHCTSRVQRAYYAMLMDQDPAGQEKAKGEFFSECREFAQAMVPESEGPFFFGKKFSLVDIAFAPFWQRFEWVGGHYRGLTFPADNPEFCRLAVWWEAVRKHPSVAATLVCRPRLIVSYSQYSTNKGTSDYAKSMQSRLQTKAKTEANPDTGSTPVLIGSALALGVALGFLIGYSKK